MLNNILQKNPFELSLHPIEIESMSSPLHFDWAISSISKTLSLAERPKRAVIVRIMFSLLAVRITITVNSREFRIKIIFLDLGTSLFDMVI